MQINCTLNLHHWEPESQSNGPGLRAVFWVQGCSLKCPGCFNPHTHNPKPGNKIPVQDLILNVQNLPSKITGITLTGGEPLEQIPALLAFVKGIRLTTQHSIILFTGFTWHQALQLNGVSNLLKNIDVVIAGPYRPLSTPDMPWLMAEKTFHFLTDRYSISDFMNIPEAEVFIQPDGNILLSGSEPLFLNL